MKSKQREYNETSWVTTWHPCRYFRVNTERKANIRIIILRWNPRYKKILIWKPVRATFLISRFLRGPFAYTLRMRVFLLLSGYRGWFSKKPRYLCSFLFLLFYHTCVSKRIRSSLRNRTLIIYHNFHFLF